MSKKPRQSLNRLFVDSFRAIDRYVAGLKPPPNDPEALRNDLKAHTLFWFEPFLKFGEKWPEPGDAKYPELETLQAAMDEDFERVMTLHHPELADADTAMLPKAHITALATALANAAMEMIGCGPLSGPATTSRNKQARGTKWPAGAAKAFPQTVLGHVDAVRRRYEVEPFGTLQHLREFAELKKLVLDFGYRWQIPGHNENIAYHVHDAFCAYRAAVNDPNGPLPPTDEAMGSRAAVHHLEHLTRRLEHLIQIVNSDEDQEGEMPPDINGLASRDTSSGPEYIREIGRQIGDLARFISYGDPSGIPDLSELRNNRVADRAGRMFYVAIQRGALSSAEHVQLRVHIEACMERSRSQYTAEQWPAVTFRSALNYFAPRSQLRPPEPSPTGSASANEVARAAKVAHGCALLAEFLNAEADRLSGCSGAKPIPSNAPPESDLPPGSLPHRALTVTNKAPSWESGDVYELLEAGRRIRQTHDGKTVECELSPLHFRICMFFLRRDSASVYKLMNRTDADVPWGRLYVVGNGDNSINTEMYRVSTKLANKGFRVEFTRKGENVLRSLR